jgi:ribosomal protein S21
MRYEKPSKKRKREKERRKQVLHKLRMKLENRLNNN